LEERVAVARQQQGGVRRRVPTSGFAIATFAHRTSRAGDPQLHTHCLIPNVVRRADGKHVAFDANPLHVWGKAAGTVFLNELERTITSRLGVAGGPERNGCREIVGFSRDQLRGFSKRTVAIETHLEAAGELAFDSKTDRMRADDRAARATRDRKDKTLTPERLRDRWRGEAEAVGLRPGVAVDNLVIGRQLEPARTLGEAEICSALVDPATGLCAMQSRFGEAQVVERVAAISGGRLTLEQILDVTEKFLGSEHVVRLTPDVAQRRPPEWSTVELRAVEDGLLAQLGALTARSCDPIAVRRSIPRSPASRNDWAEIRSRRCACCATADRPFEYWSHPPGSARPRHCTPRPPPSRRPAVRSSRWHRRTRRSPSSARRGLKRRRSHGSAIALATSRSCHTRR